MYIKHSIPLFPYTLSQSLGNELHGAGSTLSKRYLSLSHIDTKTVVLGVCSMGHKLASLCVWLYYVIIYVYCCKISLQTGESHNTCVQIFR